MTPRSPQRGDSAAGALLSIGALSAATGIPVDTIRTWERRYGFPVAERKPSGHRVYALSTVPRLRLVAQAIARGHRAAEVVPASESALEALLATRPGAPSGPVRPNGSASSRTPAATTHPADLLDAARAFDAETLKRCFQEGWARLGPLDFLERRAAPFLTAVGDGWADGSLDVRHEHFASSVLGDFLRAARLPLDDRAAGPIAVLATLPGELHVLGLQMSALVFALDGWRALMLGADTPVSQIVALAREAPVACVAISCVQTLDGDANDMVSTLRRRLPRDVPLVAGGAGAPLAARQRRIELMPDLFSLDRWLREWPIATSY